MGDADRLVVIFDARVGSIVELELESVLDRTDQLVLVTDLASRRITAVSRGLTGEYAAETLIGSDATTYVVGGASDGLGLLVNGRLDGYELTRPVRFASGVADAHLWVHALGDARPPRAAVVVIDRAEPYEPATQVRGEQLMVLGTVDDEWRLDRVSTDVEQLLGADASTLCGVSFLTLVHPGDLAELLTGLGHVQRSGDGVSVRLRLRHGPTGWIWCRAKLMALGARAGFGFVLVPLVTEGSVEDRSLDLELRLTRIAHEVNAVGGMRQMSGMPSVAELPGLSKLTSREWEIVMQLRSGARIEQIARTLHLSASTVRNHLATVYRKLGVHSQAELLVLLHTRR